VETLIKALDGIETVISTLSPTAYLAHIPLANAAKKAGVKRFIPCGFITVAPPGGVMLLRDHVSNFHLYKIDLVRRPFVRIEGSVSVIANRLRVQ